MFGLCHRVSSDAASMSGCLIELEDRLEIGQEKSAIGMKKFMKTKLSSIGDGAHARSQAHRASPSGMASNGTGAGPS